MSTTSTRSMLTSLLRNRSKSSFLSGFAMLAAPVAAPGYASILSIPSTSQQWPAAGSPAGTKAADEGRIGIDEHVSKASIHGWTPLPASG